MCPDTLEQLCELATRKLDLAQSARVIYNSFTGVAYDTVPTGPHCPPHAATRARLGSARLGQRMCCATAAGFLDAWYMLRAGGRHP
jgi:hypothetical protein